MEYSEKIMSAGCAKAYARKLNFGTTVLTYVLWDRTTTPKPQPIYVGTAKSQSRIDNHARKANGGTSLTRKSGAIPLAEHVERQSKNHGPDWIGFSFHQHNSFDDAKVTERELIQGWGIKKLGGKLFNRQMSG